MKKSIDKFNNNMGVSYFLGAFGGCDSFNDEIFESEISEILTTITYSCAKAIEKDENLEIQDIFKQEQDRLNLSISYNRNSKIEWNFKEKELKRNERKLAYINHLIGNYSIGNLHEITSNYLTKVDTHSKSR